MSRHLYKYAGRKATVRWDRQRCIHAAQCVHGLPTVFDQHRRPWIDPDRAELDALAEVISKCPSGALLLEIEGEEEALAPPPVANTCRVVADGPLYVAGRLQLGTAGRTQGETRIALCRCGHSQNKPYCDNSHSDAGFQDEGRIGEAREAEIGAGAVTLRPLADGPVLAQGPLTLFDADGEPVATTMRTALCRCGHSRKKPFCDGSHQNAGFEAE